MTMCSAAKLVLSEFRALTAFQVLAITAMSSYILQNLKVEWRGILSAGVEDKTINKP